MSFDLQIDQSVVVFFALRRFGFTLFLLLVALPRVAVGRGAARWVALAVVIGAGLAQLVNLGPAMGWYANPLYIKGAQIAAMGGGMVVPLTLSALFLTSFALPARRWRWLDRVHVAGLIGFLGLWGWISF